MQLGACDAATEQLARPAGHTLRDYRGYCRRDERVSLPLQQPPGLFLYLVNACLRLPRCCHPALLTFKPRRAPNASDSFNVAAALKYSGRVLLTGSASMGSGTCPATAPASAAVDVLLRGLCGTKSDNAAKKTNWSPKPGIAVAGSHSSAWWPGATCHRPLDSDCAKSATCLPEAPAMPADRSG